MKFIIHARTALLAGVFAAFISPAYAQDSAAAANYEVSEAESSALDSAIVSGIARIISDSFGSEVALVEEFIYEARQLEKDEKVPAKVFIGIAILESTGFTSYLYQNARNPFGMRATSIWKGPTFVMFHEGRDSKFRKYDSPGGAVRDFAAFLKSRKWFHDALKCDPSDSECFIKGLSANWKKKEPGYASDPEWPNKVRRVIKTYHLDMLN